MNELELIQTELQRPKSKRRKGVMKLVTPDLVKQIESEIIKIEFYLTEKSFKLRTTNWRPVTGDEDSPLRQRVEHLRYILKKLGIQ
jgi:hypothetical protein